MTYIQDYIATQPTERQPQIVAYILEGYVGIIHYRMIGYVVPQTRYPAGDYVNPQTPLPLIALANQTRHIAMFTRRTLAMGAGCVRFNPAHPIPC